MRRYQTLVVDSSPGAFDGTLGDDEDDDDDDDDECIDDEHTCMCACVIATDLGGGKTVFQCLADPSCPCEDEDEGRCDTCDPCDEECFEECMGPYWDEASGDCFCT